MNRRHILAAPIAALLGKVAPSKAGKWYRWRPHVIPPVTAGERFAAFQYFPPTDPTKWAPILKGIHFAPDPTKIEGGVA